MKNRILSLLLVLCLLCTILPVPVVTAAGANGSFAGGTGTASDPYLVATKEHLDNVRQYPNGHFMQTVDIAFAESDFVEGGAFYNAGAGWLPIGSQTTPFSGTYHGNGYTISGLRSYGDYIGLFSYVDGGAVIRGVTLTGVSLQGTRYVGGIAACVNAEAGAVSISDCSVSGSLAGKSYVGGFIGIGRGTAGSLSVRNCVNRAGIDVYSNGDGCGGIAGGLSGATITRCVNYGAVDGVPFSEDRGTASLGGIVGHASDDTFLACANYGDVSTLFAGGIAGSGDDCSFSYCLNTGVLTHSDDGYGKAITSGSGNNSENCFVLGTESSTGNISHATAEQMQSGEVAYQMKAYFGQTLGEDTYPILLNGTNSVYQVKNCQGEITYSNTGNDIPHSFADNVCTVCGAMGYQVAFDGYKGDNLGVGGEFEINSSFFTRLFRQEVCAAGAVIGDVLTFSISQDPLWEGMTFEGWLMYEEEGIEQGGPYYLQSGDLYTTAQVMQHTVPDYNVRYVAKWAEIPMSYYENLYDPFWGIGGDEETSIHVFACEVCSEASFTLLKDNEVLERNHHDYVVNLSQGETLGSRGYDFKDIVFWDPSRDFLGWNVCTFVEGYGYKQIEGTTTMTTEEMLAYTALDSVQLCFVGQWAGDDSAYYSLVRLDTFGGAFEVCFDGISWFVTDAWENNRSREGGTIGGENERYYGNHMQIRNFSREGSDFLGWIEYTVVNGDYQMVSGNPIDTDTMLTKTVTDNDMVFVARWSNVPWEDYENYAPGGGEGGETFNVWVSGGWYGRFVTMKNGEVWYGVSGTVWMQVPVGSSLLAEGYEFIEWEPYPEHAGEIRNRIGWYVGSWVDDNGNFEKLPGTGLLSDDEMLNYTIPAGTEIVFKAQWDEEPDGGDVPIDGYVASITADEEVFNGDRVLAMIKAKHSEETQFAAGEVVVRYDSSMLTFNKEASNLGNATVKDDNGILILEDYGEDKPFSNTAYVLAFDTKGTGTVTLNLESAAFVNKENAVKSDLIEATLDPASAVVVISRSRYPVTLDGIFTGPATATDGESYTFCAADTKHYVYDSVSVVMGGNSVGVTDNGDGSYTVERVNGPLTITGSRSERTFQVTFNGNGADKITDARPTATYGTEYVFDLPREEGAVYTLTQILIDGQVYTDYMVTGKTITIDGMHIHGDMVITVTRTVTEATVTVEGNGAGAAVGYDPKLELGKDYTLTLNPAAGYSYTVTATMNGEPAEVIDNGDNTYTIKKVTGDIVFTVTRKLVTDAVTVSQYLKINDANVWLVQYKTEVAEGKVPTYEGNPMFWSDEYDAYCYLVITEILDEEEAKSKLDITDGTAPVLGDSMDVNGSGKIDASDAQLVYNMYNAMYGAFDGDVTMEKYFCADINKDGQINVQDAAAIIAHILA